MNKRAILFLIHSHHIHYTHMINYIGCKENSVRLVGGHYDNEGTVEVCYSNLWGLISDVGWTDDDARVVCNSLGHTGGSELFKTLMNVMPSF